MSILSCVVSLWKRTRRREKPEALLPCPRWGPEQKQATPLYNSLPCIFSFSKFIIEHFCIPERKSSLKPRDHLIAEVSDGKIDKVTLRWHKIQEYLKTHDYIMNADVRELYGVSAATRIGYLPALFRKEILLNTTKADIGHIELYCVKWSNENVADSAFFCTTITHYCSIQGNSSAFKSLCLIFHLWCPSLMG